MEYQVVKSLHIISVVCWMAGLFYLPRLFVYHSEAGEKSEVSDIFEVMERRLYRGIMNPASISTWIFGIWLIILSPEFLFETWFVIKGFVVVLLTIFHHMLGRWRQDFLNNNNIRSSFYFRVANEITTVALIVIVFMVVLKP